MDLKNIHLLYNALAHFHCMEKYPDGIIQAISEDGEESLYATCWALRELHTQYNLSQKALGYEPEQNITESAFLTQLKIHQVVEAKTMIISAVIHGMKAEDDPNEEVDEVLQELQKKTEAE